MKTSKIVFLLCIVPFLTIYSADAQNNAGPEKRLALVIGNSAYTNAMELANPVNDARAMKEALLKLGFDVEEYEDLDQAGLKMAIDVFGDKLKKYSVGLFFYAGHGIQSKGANYLIPVNARLQSEQQVEYDCVQADRVLGQMEAAGSIINIVILDACRNNPFERSWSRAVNGTGLAFMNAPSGSLIAYSTSPGRTASDGSGSNGLYTAALLENLKTPGINILQMFQNVRRIVASKSDKQQIPWESTSLTNDFFFVDNTPNIVSQQDIPNYNIAESISSDSRNEISREIDVKWKHDDKVFWLYLNGDEIQERVIATFNITDLLVYDPETKNTFILEDYANKPLNKFLPAKILGNLNEAWWRYDGTYYSMIVKGADISLRTKCFAVDNDLLVYDAPTNTTYMLKDYVHCTDNRLRPATLFDNADFAFWRNQDVTFWLYVKGEEIQFRTKFSRANNDLVVYDDSTNTTYLLEGFYNKQSDTGLKPARVISYMDDVLWMKSTGNIYWIFVKGEMISEHTTNTRSGNDLNVTDTLTKANYILYDFFNSVENQFKPAFKVQ